MQICLYNLQCVKICKVSTVDFDSARYDNNNDHNFVRSLITMCACESELGSQYPNFKNVSMGRFWYVQLCTLKGNASNTIVRQLLCSLHAILLKGAGSMATILLMSVSHSTDWRILLSNTSVTPPFSNIWTTCNYYLLAYSSCCLWAVLYFIVYFDFR